MYLNKIGNIKTKIQLKIIKLKIKIWDFNKIC